MFSNLPEEIINKIIMQSVPKYLYLAEFKNINLVVKAVSNAVNEYNNLPHNDTNTIALLVEVRKRRNIKCNCEGCTEKTWRGCYYKEGSESYSDSDESGDEIN